MANVVPLRGESDRKVIEPDPRKPGYMLGALRRLFNVRAIEKDTWFLGLQLIQAFQENGMYRAVLTHKQVCSSFVTYQGRIMGGMACETLPDFLTALQELQHHLDIGSHYVTSRLEDEDWLSYHFSRDPKLSARVDYDSNTPIHFKFDPKNLEELVDYGLRFEEELRSVAAERVLTD